MERRRIAWFLSLALMAVGGVVAHVLAYRLVAASSHAYGEMLESTGHGYMEHLSVCLAICGAVATFALLASVASRVRGDRSLRAPVWLFALLPPLGFALQEHLERLLHSGAFPHAAALEPTFAVGLLLQLPFALAAYLAARALLALAVALADTLRARPRPRVLSLEMLSVTALARPGPRPSVLALGHGQRAPPLGAV